MNKYQKVIAQIVKDDKAKGVDLSFRGMKSCCKSEFKHSSFEFLVDFKNFNKKLPI